MQSKLLAAALAAFSFSCPSLGGIVVPGGEFEITEGDIVLPGVKGRVDPFDSGTTINTGLATANSGLEKQKSLFNDGKQIIAETQTQFLIDVQKIANQSRQNAAVYAQNLAPVVAALKEVLRFPTAPPADSSTVVTGVEQIRTGVQAVANSSVVWLNAVGARLNSTGGEFQSFNGRVQSTVKESFSQVVLALTKLLQEIPKRMPSDQAVANEVRNTIGSINAGINVNANANANAAQGS